MSILIRAETLVGPAKLYYTASPLNAGQYQHMLIVIAARHRAASSLGQAVHNRVGYLSMLLMSVKDRVPTLRRKYGKL